MSLAQTSWPDGRALSPAEILDYALRAESLGFDSLWCGDHFFLEFEGQRQFERAEPLVLLSYLAARTERIQLGTLVACARFRSPGQLAREAKTLADFSDGRFVLGLGAGWHQPEFDAFGIDGDRLSSRLQEYVEALLALFAGGPVDYDGHYEQLRGAEVAGSNVPPVWIAATGPRGIETLARHAQGWNFGGPKADFVGRLDALRAGEAAAGRRPGSVVASTAASALLGPREPAERLLEQHPPLIGTTTVGADALRALVEDYRAAGCDQLILHFSGLPFSAYGADQLELAAEALELGC